MDTEPLVMFSAKEQPTELRRIMIGKTEVLSDGFDLNSSDIDYLKLLETELGEKTKQIIIAGQKEFKTVSEKYGINPNFDGHSVEIPINQDNIPKVLIPSIEVLRQDTRYRNVLELSEKLKQQIAENPEVVFRVVYLRNILAHEISHLYQFSQAEIKTLSVLSQDRDKKAENGESYSDFDVEYSRFIPFREFLSCLYGLNKMIDSNPDIAVEFVEVANKLSVSGSGYIEEQARRTVKAALLLEELSADQKTDFIISLFKLARAENFDLKNYTQDKITEYLSDLINTQQFKQFIIEQGKLV